MDGYSQEYYAEILFNKKTKVYEVYKTVLIKETPKSWIITGSFGQQKEFLKKQYKRIKRNINYGTKNVLN